MNPNEDQTPTLPIPNPEPPKPASVGIPAQPVAENLEPQPTKSKKKISLTIGVFIILLILTAVVIFAFTQTQKPKEVEVVATPSPTPQATNESSIVPPYFSAPTTNYTVSSPLEVKGVIPAGWMFEGQLPIKLLDSKREIIVATNALETTPGSWQSGEPTEFSTTLSWIASSLGGSTSGYLVISKDNPSGLPENDKSYEIPVKF